MDDSQRPAADLETTVSAPNKKTRASRAQLVVEAARRRNAAQGNVQNLPSTRLEHGTADGKQTLAAIFPKKGGGEPHRLNLSFLLEFPGLTNLFAEGMLKWLNPLEPTSRIESLQRLRRHWFGYLAEGGLRELVPQHLDEQIMAGFNTWLHQQRKANGQPLHPNNLRQSLSVLRCALAAAPGARHWLDLVPAGPRGAHRKSEPTVVLQFDQLLAVMAAVESEVLALRDRWALRQRLLEQGQRHLQEGRKLQPSPKKNKLARSEANLALAMAIIDQRYSGVIPDREVISADTPLLGRTVKLVFGITEVAGYFYANSRDLVPLALSLTFATIFNPETVLKLAWKNIDRKVDRLSNGRSAVQFEVTNEDNEGEKGVSTTVSDAPESPLAKVTGDKPRAKRQLVRLLDPEASGPDQVSLNLVLDLLTAMTARIRPHVVDRERDGDRVFLFVPQRLEKRAKGFGSSTKAATNDEAWKNALEGFIADNQLPHFTLKTIRATLIDYVQLINRGDLDAARDVGNHGSRVTTWTHYTSNLVKRLLQEVTGETLLVRERWLDSEGKLDPRQHRDWANKGCATPGWICLDPFDSPRPNQKQGRLCSAYGECPDCPLSAARPVNPRNVMLYEALRRAIYRSVSRVTAAVWHERWAPVVAALDGLLANVPAQVLEESRKHIVELPDIG